MDLPGDERAWERARRSRECAECVGVVLRIICEGRQGRVHGLVEERSVGTNLGCEHDEDIVLGHCNTSGVLPV